MPAFPQLCANPCFLVLLPQIKLPGVHNRYKIIEALIEEGFNDIGIANDFVHAGFLRNSFAESKIYTYSDFKPQ